MHLLSSGEKIKATEIGTCHKPLRTVFVIWRSSSKKSINQKTDKQALSMIFKIFLKNLCSL